MGVSAQVTTWRTESPEIVSAYDRQVAYLQGDFLSYVCLGLFCFQN